MRKPARLASVAGALTLALTIAFGLAGAARQPDALVVQIPGLRQCGAALALTAILAVLARGLPPLAAGLGLAPLVLTCLIGAPGHFGAVTGHVLLAPSLAVAVLVLWRARALRSDGVFFTAVLLVYIAVAGHLQSQIGPEGDGAHYLVVTQSLLRDHDLDLRADFEQQRYREFYAGALTPHRRVRGRLGETFSLHAVGLSILLLPAFAVGGSMAASFFMALLAAALALEIRCLIRAWLKAPRLAEGVGWLVALSPPLIYYAGAILTEVPAALLIAIVLRHGRRVTSAATWKALGLGIAVACLPWLNVRYGIPAAVLLVFLLSCAGPRWRLVAPLVGPALASVCALALYHQVLYGFVDPRRVYGSHPEASLAHIPSGVFGLFLDQEFGLLPYAPAFALAVPGLVALARSGWRLAGTTLALTGAVVLTSAAWPMWRGGFNPPARFLVPLLPVLAIALAAALKGGGRRRVGFALLAGWGLWTGAGGALEPSLVHRDRDWTAPLFRAASGAREWTLLLPGFVPPEHSPANAYPFADRGRLAALWCAALTLALFGPARPRRTTLRLAAAAAGMLVVCACASALSSGASEGRDAVRCLGRRALALPTCRPATEAVWDTASLAWKGRYEETLVPYGVRLGSRLPLATGRYRLGLDASETRVGAPPLLVVRSEGRRFDRHTGPLQPTAGGFETEFDVHEGERAVTLAIRGGAPTTFTRVRLAVARPPSALTREQRSD